jgi:hypothetical protein
MVTPILRKISKWQRGVNLCERPNLENILKGKGDESMKGGSITPGKLSSSLNEWSH